MVDPTIIEKKIIGEISFQQCKYKRCNTQQKLKFVQKLHLLQRKISSTYIEGLRTKF